MEERRADLGAAFGRPSSTDSAGAQHWAMDRLLDVYEHYRRTVAYEIHDGIVQAMVDLTP